MSITTERIAAAAKKLCEAPGPSGRECAAYAAAKELLSPMGEVKRTPLGSLLCCVNEGKEGAPHLLLEAHLDQIGFIVTRVEEGFLRFSKIGGIDARWLPATPVVIHAAAGDYPGIITSVPPHLAGDGSDHSIKIENLLIDTGFTAETAAKLCARRYCDLAAKPVELLNKRLAGPALDDRIGCAAVIAAAEEIAAEKPDCKVTVLLSSMEEVGGQGAETGGFTTQPDYAIAVDVSFGDGFGCAPEKTSPLGGGTMLGYTPTLNRDFTLKLKKLAEENNIPLQHEPMGGRTGTDADELATAGRGIKMALLSIPLRSMHTVAETIDPEDAANTARLMALAAKEGF
ncbi:MAG: M42 family metallopeptidase [Angelakisella sp.]